MKRRSLIAAVVGNRRPVRHGGRQRRSQRREAAGAVDHIAADDGQNALQIGDALVGHREVIGGKHREIRVMPRRDAALPPNVTGKPCTALGPEAKGFFSVEQVVVAIQGEAAHGSTRRQPAQGHPRVVACHPGRIGSCADGHSGVQHPADRGGLASRVGTIPSHEVLALVRHPVLDGDASTQGLDPINVAWGDRLRMVDEPGKPREGRIPVHGLVDIENPADALVVGRMDAEGPAVLNQMADDAGQITLEVCG